MCCDLAVDMKTELWTPAKEMEDGGQEPVIGLAEQWHFQNALFEDIGSVVCHVMSSV